MSNLAHHILSARPLPIISTTSGASAGGAIISFSEATLPLVQWFAALAAIASGLLAIAVGAYHVKEIYKREQAERSGLPRWLRKVPSQEENKEAFNPNEDK